MNTPVTPAKPAVVPTGPAIVKPPSSISAPKVLLMGPPGTGKTWSIVTLLQAGIEVFVLITEPGGEESLLNAVQKVNPTLISKLHWRYVPPVTAGWGALTEVLKTIGNSNFEQISGMKSGIAKTTDGNIMKLFKQLQNFEDEHTGQAFGDVTTWDTSRALVIDSLSGLNNLALQHTVGLKPTMSQGEWGVAMNLELMLIEKLTADLKCYFVVCAHVDRNISEVTGGMIVTPAAIGAKLGPKIGRYFSEIVLTKRIGAKFVWSTEELNTDVKNRSLPIGKELDPSFGQLVTAYNNRKKQISG